MSPPSLLAALSPDLLSALAVAPSLVLWLRWVGPPALPTPPLLPGCLWGWTWPGFNKLLDIFPSRGYS